VARTSGLIAASALVVGMTIGGTLGYLAGSSQRQDAPAASSPTTPAAPAPDDPSAPRRAARRTTSDPLDPSTMNVDVPAPIVGTGTIGGIVRTAAGVPLAGVLVRATAVAVDEDRDADPPRRAGSPPPRSDVERKVRELVSRLRTEEASRREATTDVDGAFTLTGVADGAHRLEAWLVGWRIDRVIGTTLTPVRAGGRCDFKATPVRAVQVALLLPDRSAPETATVSWKPDGAGEAGESAWTHDVPEVDVPPGAYEFTATSDLKRRRVVWDGEVHPPLYRGGPQTAVVAADSPTSLTLRLVGRPGVLVKVAFASPDHPRHVRIVAMKLDGSGPAEPSRLLTDAPPVRSAWLDDETQGALAGLDPGPYLVGVTFRGGRLGPTAVVSVGAELATAELRVPAGEIRDWVKVWVRSPDGALVRDAGIECGCFVGDSEGNDSSLVLAADADGSYRVPHFEGGAPMLGFNRSGGDERGEEARRYFVRAVSGLYGTAQSNYVPATDAEVTIQFAAPARARATILGYAASPERERLRVCLVAKDDGKGVGVPSWEGAIDAAGVATFYAMAPGEYDLVLRVKSDRDAPVIARVGVVLGVGDNALSIGVPGLIDLVVTFDAGVVTSSLQIQSVDADGVPVQVVRDVTPDDGAREASFANLAVAPGRYRLVARDVGDMWIDLPGPTRIAFKPRPFNALQVRIPAAAKGYLGEAGLRNGDVIVAIDGVELESKLQTDACLALAKSHDSAKLAVIRAGRRFEVAVDAKRLDDGGRLAPWAR